ncbi:MAG: hypothetical protein ACYCTV_04300, partial [Leptospirales bacterium]
MHIPVKVDTQSGKLDSDSDSRWTPGPMKVDSDSDSSWTVILVQGEHPSTCPGPGTAPVIR